MKRRYRFFENYVRFLQDNGLIAKEVLKQGEKANEDSNLRYSNFTEEGFEFYLFGVTEWIEEYDKAKDEDKDKVMNDFAFIEKKLKEFRAKNQ